MINSDHEYNFGCFLMAYLKENKTKIPLAAMGVLATGSAHAGPSGRPPIDTSRNFSDACVCRVTFKHLPQPLRSHIRSFGTLGQLLKIPPCPPKDVIVGGVGRVPEFF